MYIFLFVSYLFLLTEAGKRFLKIQPHEGFMPMTCFSLIKLKILVFKLLNC